MAMKPVFVGCCLLLSLAAASSTGNGEATATATATAAAAAAAAATLPLHHRTGCRDDLGCSLLGTCKKRTGKCTCDPGWTGTDCSAAAFKPLDLKKGYHNTSAASWGGRAVQSADPAQPDLWHMYLSQFSNKCNLAYWTHNSFVARLDSSTGAGGPYAFAEKVYPEFHHNPSIVGPTPDGYYLLFMIGISNASNVLSCENTSTPIPLPKHGGMGEPTGTISMGYSKSPTGPWSESRIVLQNFKNPAQNQSSWDCYVTNPSAVIFPNSTVMLVFSSVPCAGGFEEALGAAFAPHWNDTYTEDVNAIWRKPGPRASASTTGVGNVEDPFAWRDARGNYHIVAHSQGHETVCGGQPYGKHVVGGPGNACGVHFYAPTAYGPWKPSLTPVYTGAALLTNGSTAALFTRQRPQIIFAADGTTPRYMVNGGSFDEYNTGTISLERTFMFEFESDTV